MNLRPNRSLEETDRQTNAASEDEKLSLIDTWREPCLSFSLPELELPLSIYSESNYNISDKK